MEVITSNDAFKIWINQFDNIKDIELPQELQQALYLNWFEYVGIFIIPVRNQNGWACKIEDVGLVPLSNFNSFPNMKTRSEAVGHAIEIAVGLLR